MVTAMPSLDFHTPPPDRTAAAAREMTEMGMPLEAWGIAILVVGKHSKKGGTSLANCAGSRVRGLAAVPPAVIGAVRLLAGGRPDHFKAVANFVHVVAPGRFGLQDARRRFIVSAGVAALDHRLMAFDPSGIDHDIPAAQERRSCNDRFSCRARPCWSFVW